MKKSNSYTLKIKNPIPARLYSKLFFRQLKHSRRVEKKLELCIIQCKDALKIIKEIP